MSEVNKSADRSLAEVVAEGLREREPHYFMMEQYGPDGEIVEVWEGHPVDPEQEGAHTVSICAHGYAEPRKDWRERGVVPPRGFHRHGGGE